MCIRDSFGSLKGIHFVYFGDARYNMGNSLLVGCAKMGLNFTACAPKKLSLIHILRATELTLLAKSLRPLPEKFPGLTDTEMRYRQRYVDLIANPEVKDTFVKRSQILKEIRAYLDEKGFLEVDTPILTPFEIGASARPCLLYTARCV